MGSSDVTDTVSGDDVRTEVVAIRRGHRRDAAADVAEAWDDGHAVLVLEPTVPDRVAADLLARVRPSVLVHERPDGRRRLTRLPRPRPLPGEVGAIVATSGTTGTPSLVVLGRAALASSTRLGLDRLGARPDEPWALTLPLDHVAGLLVLRRAAAGAHDVEVQEPFRPRTLLAGDATWWALVPTMLRRVVDTGSSLAGRRVLLGGAAADERLLDAARDLGAEVTTSYGMTETCGGCVYDGLPLDGVEVELVDDRIRVRGPVVADGRVEGGDVVPVTDADGWLRTADRARWDDDRLVVLGRDDDVVVTGGVNVATPAVAAVLRDHPDVVDAAVVGVPDATWGHRLEAFVVLGVGARPDEVAWADAVRTRLGREAVPKGFHVLDAIPRANLAKPDLDALRRLATPD